METPQRFEGASIEEVLRRVRAELGTDAEIVEANKVRSGGIGGFFSKESYEVLAQPVPGPRLTGRPVPAPTASPGRTVGPMLQGRQPVPAPASPPATAAPDRAGGSATVAPVSLLDMAERVSAAEAAGTDDAPTPSGPDAAPPPARRSRAQQVAEQVMAEHLRQMGSPPEGPVDPVDFQPLQPAEMPRISTEGSAFTEVLQRIANDAGHEIAHAMEGPDHRAIAHTEMAADVGDGGDTGGGAAQVASDRMASDRLPVPRRHDIEPAQSRTERLLSWLELDHLPQTTLISALRSLPQMESLPATRGVVVAVVGERSRALRLCRQLARDCDSDPRDVVLASPSYRGSAIPEEQRIIDLTDAARDRRGWRRRTAPTFVAVESPTTLDPQAQSWTRGVVEALDAHQVIGVVRASRKAEDVRAWADVIGGVDGLALEELGETTTPYAVLALEIPVAFLGDQAATPGSWARMLMERTAA